MHFDFKKTAVLVLDVQNDFCHEDGAFHQYLGWDASPLREMTSRLGLFLDRLRSAGATIVFSQMVNDAVESPQNLREKLATSAESAASQWPFGLKRKTWGYDFYQLEPKVQDLVLEKKYFDFFSSPQLAQELEARNVENVIVVGLYTEVCIFSTVSSAFTRGCRVTVPSDMTASVAEHAAWRNHSLEIMGAYLATVTTSENIN